MAISRSAVETQIQKTLQALEQRAAFLNERRLDPRQQKRDPIVRKLEARVRKCKARLKAIEVLETRDQELLTRKSTGRPG